MAASCYPAVEPRSAWTDRQYWQTWAGFWFHQIFYGIAGILFFYGIMSSYDANGGLAEPQDPGYGFYLLGNDSLLEPHVMNRTDANVSSPTYGLWTPPPSWRDECIKSGGLPIIACSYFQSTEYPAFMRSFFVWFYLVQFIAMVIRCRMGLDLVYHVAFVSVPELGWAYVFRPARWMHAKTCWKFDMMHMWAPLVIVLAPMWFAYDFYALFGSGMALVNSLGSGYPYLGAGWNAHPFPRPDELNNMNVLQWLMGTSELTRTFIPIGWYNLLTINGHFFTLFHSSLGALTFFPDVMRFYYPMIYAYFPLLLQAYVTSDQVQKQEGQDIMHRPCYGPLNKLKTWIEWQKTNHVFEYLPHVFWVTAIFEVPHRTVWRASYLPEGYSLKKWLGFVHFWQCISMFSLPPMIIFFLVFWIHTLLKMSKAKKLSGSVSVATKFKVIRFLGSSVIVYSLSVYLGAFFLLPNGALLQAFGVEGMLPLDASYLWSSAPTDPAMMLCAPMLRLVFCTFILILECFIYVDLSPFAVPKYQFVKRKDPSQV
jgi:hypothetical protein